MKNFFLVSCFIGFVSAYGQEYDDLYFNKSDREKQKKGQVERANPNFSFQDTASQQEAVEEPFEATSFLGKQYNYEVLPEDELIAGSVSQESIDQYKSGKTIETYTNPNFSSPGQVISNPSINTEQVGQNANFSNPQDPYQNEPVVIIITMEMDGIMEMAGGTQGGTQVLVGTDGVEASGTLVLEICGVTRGMIHFGILGHGMDLTARFGLPVGTQAGDGMLVGVGTQALVGTIGAGEAGMHGVLHTDFTIDPCM